jgi:uncharacterized RDD family membrane protein YckC
MNRNPYSPPAAPWVVVGVSLLAVLVIFGAVVAIALAVPSLFAGR